MHSTESVCTAVRVGPLPDDFIEEELGTKDAVHQQFEVVACGRVAVQVDGAGLLENSAKFHKAWCHHGKVREHVSSAEEGSESPHSFGDAATSFDGLFVGEGGLFVPLPCVFEGGDLRGGACAVLLGKEDVIVLTGVEGWVEIDEVGGVGGDVIAENREVIAVVEFVLLRGHW